MAMTERDQPPIPQGGDAVPTLGADLLRREGFQLIDLSRDIFEGMPMFGAHQKPYMMVNQTHEGWIERYGHNIGFEAHNWIMSEHTGTHTDSLLEYIPGGPGLERTPLEYFYGEAVCLDLSDVRYPDYITERELEAAEGRGPGIRRGDIVLLYTGHGERTYPTKEYLEPQAGLSRSGALWLAERGVVNIGIDAVAIDHSDDEEFSGHRVCAEYRIVNTEGLTNLDRLVNRRFVFIGLPLMFRAGTGSPIRAVAWLREDA
jgi:kynurenine formamidase